MSRATLPGTIPGLIRRCSPVVGEYRGYENLRPNGEVVRWDGVVLCAHKGSASVALPDEAAEWVGLDHVSLDLEDPTGQTHAARWLDEQGTSAFILGTTKRAAYEKAAAGLTLSGPEVEALRLLVLEIAEVAP